MGCNAVAGLCDTTGMTNSESALSGGVCLAHALKPGDVLHGGRVVADLGRVSWGSLYAVRCTDGGDATFSGPDAVVLLSQMEV